MPNDPIIYSGPADTGYTPSSGADAFGLLGEIFAVTFHHSGGPRATTKARAIALNKAYQRSHIERGFGDIGYHFSLDDLGRFYRLRSTKYRGAHVGGGNTGNIGIMVHGNYQTDQLTAEQGDSLRWLFTGGFLKLFNEPEGDIAIVRGHREWPGHYPNECPGVNLTRRINFLRSTQFS